jgi:hypothetical protein
MFPPPRPAAHLTGPIHRLLDEAVAHPLLHLSERGFQVRLAHLIQAALPAEQRLAAAQIVLGSLHGYRTQDRVARVQHAVRLLEVADLPAPDVLLLRAATPEAPVQLLRQRRGHLDLEPAARACDTEAVFVIRAGCSADPAGCQGFRAGVEHLHGLARACQQQGLPAPECHLVLVDRSMAVREHASCQHSQRQPYWDVADDRPWSWAGAGRLGSSHVHVWDFDEAGEPRHRVSVA